MSENVQLDIVIPEEGDGSIHDGELHRITRRGYLVQEYQTKNTTLLLKQPIIAIEGFEEHFQDEDDEGPFTINSVNHPNILACKGIFRSEKYDSTHIVYEPYLCTLNEFRNDNKSILYDDWQKRRPSRLLIKLLRDIFKALTYLVRSGKIHGNLTLDNIVIVKYGEEEAETEFYIAKLRNLVKSKQTTDFYHVKKLLEDLFKSDNSCDEATHLIRNFGEYNLDYKGDLWYAIDWNAVEVLNHPLFFDENRWIDYLRKYIDVTTAKKFMAIYSGFTQFNASKEWNKAFTEHRYDLVFKMSEDSWTEYIENPSTKKWKDVANQKKRHFDSTIQLLKFYRNLVIHKFKTISDYEVKDVEELRSLNVVSLMKQCHPFLMVEMYKVYEKLRRKISLEDMPDMLFLGEFYPNPLCITPSVEKNYVVDGMAA